MQRDDSLEKRKCVVHTFCQSNHSNQMQLTSNIKNPQIEKETLREEKTRKTF